MTVSYYFFLGKTKEPSSPETETAGIHTPPDNGLSVEAIDKFNEGDFKNAIALFEKIPVKNGRVLTGLGISHFKLGDYENALRYLEDAKAVLGNTGSRDTFMASKFLALAYLMKDDFDKGIANAEIGLAIENDEELNDLLDKLKKEKTTRGKHINASSLNFKIVFDGMTQVEAGHLITRMLEEARWEIGTKLGYFPTVPIAVILYTEKDFYDVIELPAWAAGVYDYDGKIRLPVKDLTDKNAETLRKIVFHEYSHALVHSIARNTPLWFNEGLAEYFSKGPSSGNTKPVNLKAIEKSFPSDRAGASESYNASRAALTSLIEKNGFFAVKRYLLELSKGSPTEDAFRSAFFTDYGEFVE